jgi:hypothetical protein
MVRRKKSREIRKKRGWSCRKKRQIEVAAAFLGSMCDRLLQ